MVYLAERLSIGAPKAEGTQLHQVHQALVMVLQPHRKLQEGALEVQLLAHLPQHLCARTQSDRAIPGMGLRQGFGDPVVSYIHTEPQMWGWVAVLFA